MNFVFLFVGFFAGLMFGALFSTLGWLETFGLTIKQADDFEERRKEAEIINELMKNNNVVGKS